MIFGQNYFDVLTSRIGGASNSWNRQGLSNVNSKGRTTGVRGSSRISGAGNSYYGISANTIKAMNNAYNTTANKSFLARECEIMHRLHPRQRLLQADIQQLPVYMVLMDDMEQTICLADMVDTDPFFHPCSPAGSNK